MYLMLSLKAPWKVVFNTTVPWAGKCCPEDTEITDSGLGLSQYTCLLWVSNCKLCFWMKSIRRMRSLMLLHMYTSWEIVQFMIFKGMWKIPWRPNEEPPAPCSSQYYIPWCSQWQRQIHCYSFFTWLQFTHGWTSNCLHQKWSQMRHCSDKHSSV